MLNKRDKQFILQVQVATVFLQSIMIVWLIKSEWSVHTGAVIGVIIYTIIMDYIGYKAILLLVAKIKSYKRNKR